jgi:hypothetical protein
MSTLTLRGTVDGRWLPGERGQHPADAVTLNEVAVPSDIPNYVAHRYRARIRRASTGRYRPVRAAGPTRRATDTGSSRKPPQAFPQGTRRDSRINTNTNTNTATACDPDPFQFQANTIRWGLQSSDVPFAFCSATDASFADNGRLQKPVEKPFAAAARGLVQRRRRTRD